MARVPRIIGAFQGATPTTTPHGMRTPMAMLSGTLEGMISPWIWVVNAAASRSTSAATLTLKPAQPRVAPVSSTIRSMKSAWRCSISSAAFSSLARRSPGPVCDHASNAWPAASAAALASPTLAAAAVVTTSPLNGFARVKVAVCSAGVDWPANIS